jgi:hypothetical protein
MICVRHPTRLAVIVASPTLCPKTWSCCRGAYEQLGISEATGYWLARTGKIPGQFRIGAQYRISVSAFGNAVHGVNTQAGGDAR